MTHLPTSTYKCEAFLDATKSTTIPPICCSPSSVKMNATVVPLAVVTETSIPTGSVQFRTVKETFQLMLLFTQTSPVQSVFGVQDSWRLAAAAADKLWHSFCDGGRVGVGDGEVLVGCVDGRVSVGVGDRVVGCDGGRVDVGDSGVVVGCDSGRVGVSECERISKEVGQTMLSH